MNAIAQTDIPALMADIGRRARAAAAVLATASAERKHAALIGAAEAVNKHRAEILAENARDNDLVVNPTTAKQLTNMRTTSSDEAIVLKPARKMTLEAALEYIEDDELVEVTPTAIRIRKVHLTENARKRAGKKTADVVG